MGNSAGKMPDFKERNRTGAAAALGVTYAVCQIPTYKDEDRFDVSFGSFHSGTIHEKMPDRLSSLDRRDTVACFGIYDGHGGSEVARLCSQSLVASIIRRSAKRKRLARRTIDEQASSQEEEEEAIPDECIGAAYHEADSISKTLYKHAGATAINLFVSNNEDGSRSVKCAWAGDSRASLHTHAFSLSSRRTKNFRKSSYISFDHDPTREDERERIKEHNKIYNDAYIRKRTSPQGDIGPDAIFRIPKGSEQNNPYNISIMMSRSIGDYYHSSAVISAPETTTFTVQKDESVRIVLASDGLW
eukprot:CAMPEP_0197532506 /NCGR_PEP_ID=MMETSP1318-20131121/39962_1 /TAXON_ID=552666 /ORGANISM="Partenskyella glossopodia, Strain RCC365" /LENGTH=301 /DNA_ID=CAMNT_0043089083 /DNA_START=98 /DNA_END=1000 /DNA_ORIENTATION=+